MEFYSAGICVDEALSTLADESLTTSFRNYSVVTATILCKNLQISERKAVSEKPWAPTLKGIEFLTKIAYPSEAKLDIPNTWLIFGEFLNNMRG